MIGVPPVADSGVVHVIADAEAALGDDLQRLLTDHLGRVGLVGVQGSQGGLFAEACEHLQKPLLGTVGGGHQCPGVSLQQVRVPGVSEDDPVGLVVQLALVDDLDGRNQRAVVEYLGVGRADAAGPGAAQVPEMGERVTVGHDLAFKEHRG